MNNPLFDAVNTVDSNNPTTSEEAEVTREITVINGVSKPIRVVDGILMVETDSSIEASWQPCVEHSKTSELIIRGNNTRLYLKGCDRQPCIGPRTNDNLSYGRWERSVCIFHKLILDNVHVVCEPFVKNFSIGTYGAEEVPEIVLLNGATIDCPEVKGTRVMTLSGLEGIYGSTKAYNPAVYDLVIST